MIKTKQDLENYVQEIIQKEGVQGEQLLEIGFAQIMAPVWYYAIVGAFTSFLDKSIMLALTSQRLIIIRVSTFLEPQSFVSYPLSQLKLIKYSKGLLRNSFQILLPDGRKEKFTFYKFGGPGWGNGSDKIAMSLQKM